MLNIICTFWWWRVLLQCWRLLTGRGVGCWVWGWLWRLQQDDSALCRGHWLVLSSVVFLQDATLFDGIRSAVELGSELEPVLANPAAAATTVSDTVWILSTSFTASPPAAASILSHQCLCSSSRSRSSSAEGGRAGAPVGPSPAALLTLFRTCPHVCGPSSPHWGAPPVGPEGWNQLLHNPHTCWYLDFFLGIPHILNDVWNQQSFSEGSQFTLPGSIKDIITCGRYRLIKYISQIIRLERWNCSFIHWLKNECWHENNLRPSTSIRAPGRPGPLSVSSTILKGVIFSEQ